MLLWIPASVDRTAEVGAPRRVVHRSIGSLIAGLAATIVLFVMLGPGIFFDLHRQSRGRADALPGG